MVNWMNKRSNILATLREQKMKPREIVKSQSMKSAYEVCFKSPHDAVKAQKILDKEGFRAGRFPKPFHKCLIVS